MKEAVLVLALAGLFVFGYFLMRRLDKFIVEIRQANKKDKDDTDYSVSEAASCVMLTGELTDEEVAAEVRRFRKDHENTRIMLYEESEAEAASDSEQQN